MGDAQCMSITTGIAVPNPALSYDALWQCRCVQRDRSPINAVFHLHVPKAGGNSIRKLFERSGFALRDFDMNQSDFFSSQTEREQWLGNHGPTLLTGHYRLDARFLRECSATHTIITLLRDPLERIRSHFDHTISIPGSPWREQILAGDMTFLQYAETFTKPGSVGPQYAFFDDTGPGTFAWSGKSDPAYCLDNLFTKVGNYGIMDGQRERRFLEATSMLLGINLPDTLPVENVTPRRKELSEAERRALTDMFRDDVHFFQMAKVEWDDRNNP
jgi:hypothetical protein